jgi:hypothetical protein
VAQHDYVIANGTGAAVRSDLNNGLAAIVSQNSGTTEPTTTYAYMRWADTTAGVMKMRNGANNAWITLYQLDGEWSTIAFENGSASAPSIYFKDSGTDTGIYSPGTDQVAISTAGTGRLFVNASGNVGLGTGSPTENLDVVDTETASNVAVLARNLATTGNSNALFGLRGNNNAVRANWFLDGLGSVFVSAGAILYTETNHPLMFGTNNAERMRLTSTGLGIGTTTPSTPLHISNASNAEVRLQSGSYDAYIGQDSSGVLAISQAQAGSIKLQTNGSERARIDSSGRLLVGTSSNTSIGGASNGHMLQIAHNNDGGIFGMSVRGTTGGGVINIANGVTSGAPSTNSLIGRIGFSGYDGTDFANDFARIECFADASSSNDDVPGRLVFSTTADGASSPTERMRIGNAGKTNLFDSSGGGLRVSSAGAAGSTDNIFTGFYSATSTTSEGTASIAIRTNGDVRNANNSYGSLSDAKLKENIVNASSQWDDLKALQVRNFNFKEGQTHRQIGLIAQEVELVSPGLVNETPDRDEDGNETGEVTKGVNYSVLYMKAVKALQEAMERIETLEAKVAALEAA